MGKLTTLVLALTVSSAGAYDLPERAVPEALSLAHRTFVAQLNHHGSNLDLPLPRCGGSSNAETFICGYSVECLTILIGGSHEKITTAGVVAPSRGVEECTRYELAPIQRAFAEAFVSCDDGSDQQAAVERLVSARVEHPRPYIQPGDVGYEPMPVCGSMKAVFYAVTAGNRLQETLALMNFGAVRPSR